MAGRLRQGGDRVAARRPWPAVRAANRPAGGPREASRGRCPQGRFRQAASRRWPAPQPAPSRAAPIRSTSSRRRGSQAAGSRTWLTPQPPQRARRSRVSPIRPSRARARRGFVHPHGRSKAAQPGQARAPASSAVCPWAADATSNIDTLQARRHGMACPATDLIIFPLLGGGWCCSLPDPKPQRNPLPALPAQGSRSDTMTTPEPASKSRPRTSPAPKPARLHDGVAHQQRLGQRAPRNRPHHR